MLSKKLKSPCVEPSENATQWRKSEAKNWCAPVFCESVSWSFVKVCVNIRHKFFLGDGWNVSVVVNFVFVVVVATSSLLSLVMFLLIVLCTNKIQHSLYLVISLVFPLYDTVTHMKKPIQKWFCIPSVAVKVKPNICWYLLMTQMCWFCWLDGIPNSHVGHSLFKHLVYMYQFVQFTIHWEKWKVLHCLDFMPFQVAIQLGLGA